MAKTQNLFSIFKHKWLWTTVVFALSFFHFSRGIPQNSIGFLSSDLFLAMGYKGGVMPSPGYPLYTGLLHFFTQLPLPLESIASKGHLLSTILGSLTLSVFFLLTWQLHNLLSKRQTQNFRLFTPELERLSLALGVTGILASARLFWRAHLYTERFALTHLLLVLATYFLINTLLKIKNKQNPQRPLLLGSLAIGIGLSHQWIFIAVLVSYLWMLWAYQEKIRSVLVPMVMTILLSAAFFFSWLFMFNNNAIEYAWIIDPGIQGLIDYLLIGYLGDGLARASTITGLASSLEVDIVLNNLWEIAKIMLSSFGLFILVPLAGISVFGATKAEKIYLRAILSVGFFLSLGLALVIDWSGELIRQSEIVQLYALAHIPVALLLWFGLWEIIHRFGAAGIILAKRWHVQTGLMVCLVLLTSYSFYGRHSSVSLADKTFLSTAYSQVFEQADENALIGCFSVNSCYGLIYQHVAENKRPDTIIAPFYYLPNTIRLNTEGLTRFNYQTPPWVMFDILTWSLQQRPVFVVNMFDTYYSLLGINSGFINYIPLGYASEIRRGLPEQYPEIDIDPSKGIRHLNIERWDKSLQATALDFSKNHMFNGSIYMKSSLRDLTVPELNLATNLAQHLTEAEKAAIVEFRGGIESIRPAVEFDSKEEIVTFEELMQFAEESIENGLRNRARQFAQGAVILEPENVEARLLFADQLAALGASPSAVIEYNNVLLLDENNQTAKDRLEYQENLQ